MDTSELYIKMCDKAVEIQALWQIEIGDTWWHDNEGNDYMGCYEFPAGIVTATRKSASGTSVWLPRQDQLQEMVEHKSPWFLLDNLTDFMSECLIDWELAPKDSLHTPPPKKQWQFASMEQLWLAFVMREKFGKVWNGEEWASA